MASKMILFQLTSQLTKKMLLNSSSMRRKIFNSMIHTTSYFKAGSSDDEYETISMTVSASNPNTIICRQVKKEKEPKKINVAKILTMYTAINATKDYLSWDNPMTREEAQQSEAIEKERKRRCDINDAKLAADKEKMAKLAACVPEQAERSCPEVDELKNCHFFNPRGQNFYEGLDHENQSLIDFNKAMSDIIQKTMEPAERHQFVLDMFMNIIPEEDSPLVYKENDLHVEEFIKDSAVCRSRKLTAAEFTGVITEGNIPNHLIEIFLNRLYQRSLTRNWLPNISFSTYEFMDNYLDCGDVAIVEDRNVPNAVNVSSPPLSLDRSRNTVEDFIESCFGSDPLDCEILFIPIFNRYRLQHFLFVVDYRQRRISLFKPFTDYSGGAAQRDLTDALKYIRFLMTELSRKIELDLDWSEWCFADVDGIPLSPDIKSHGAFICNIAEYYSRRAPIDFPNTGGHLEKIKCRILHSILNNDGKMLGDPSKFI